MMNPSLDVLLRNKLLHKKNTLDLRVIFCDMTVSLVSLTWVLRTDIERLVSVSLILC